MPTYFAADSTGLSALGVDGKAFLIQLITFVLVYFVLRRFAFGPIVKILNERRATIDSGVSLGEQMRKQKAEMDTTIAKTLSDARTKADAILADAQSTAKDTVRSAEDEAAQKAKVIVEEGKQRGEQEVSRARKALETELVDLISNATEAIIDEKVDAKKDAALIDRALKEQRA